MLRTVRLRQYLIIEKLIFDISAIILELRGDVDVLTSVLMMSLYNKVALVTGAAKGIGLAISKALLEKKGKVRNATASNDNIGKYILIYTGRSARHPRRSWSRNL